MKQSFSVDVLFVLRKCVKKWALVLVTVVILIAITVILRLYDQQPQLDWKLGLNLNSWVILLSILFRSSLVIVIEEGKLV